MKQTVLLTESDINRIINEAITDINRNRQYMLAETRLYGIIREVIEEIEKLGSYGHSDFSGRLFSKKWMPEGLLSSAKALLKSYLSEGLHPSYHFLHPTKKDAAHNYDAQLIINNLAALKGHEDNVNIFEIGTSATYNPMNMATPKDIEKFGIEIPYDNIRYKASVILGRNTDTEMPSIISGWLSDINDTHNTLDTSRYEQKPIGKKSKKDKKARKEEKRKKQAELRAMQLGMTNEDINRIINEAIMDYIRNYNRIQD